MKADQLNRFMSVNGRKNLWLLRNTNQLYEHAVKTYYQRSNSLLPYNPKSQEAKTREENRAPVRTLTSQRERNSMPEYPRNHQQMAEQATCANSGNLLNTVMQANRRRSMSFTGSLPSYIYNNSNNNNNNMEKCTRSGGGNQRLSRERRRERQSSEVDDVVNELDLGILNGRSMSLPPRSTFELGMSFKLNKDKGPPCHKHHINAIEKSTSAAVAALARHKNDPDKLMVVDQALKDRLAVRFDRQSDDEPIPARFGLGYGSAAAGIIDGRPLPNVPSQRAPTTTTTTMTTNTNANTNTNTNTNTISKEQTRFQTLGERIRQFEVIQFADGPVTYQAFNRRHGYGRARVQPLSNDKHIPRQEPCLSFRNVLHTNHRQRCLKSRTSEPQLQVPQLRLQRLQRLQLQPESKAKAPQVMQLATPPLGPLESLTPANWRPQQQQQQPQPTMEPLPKLSNSRIKRIKSRRCDYQGNSNSSKHSSNSNFSCNHNNSNSNNIHMNPKQFKVKAREKPKMRDDGNSSHTEQTSLQSAAFNKMSRSSHMSYIQHDSTTTTPTPTPTIKPIAMPISMPIPKPRKGFALRKLEEELPKQPHVVKGAHHLLAASASQVSAYRRAFKNRQQILQAEMLHSHVQDQPHYIVHVKKPMQSLPRPLAKRDEIKATIATTTTVQPAIANPLRNTMKPTLKQEKEKIKSTAQMQRSKMLLNSKQKPEQKSMPMPMPMAAVTVACNSPKHRRSSVAQAAQLAAPSVALDKPSASSRALQKLQQQQLHQQLQQRRQQPLESLWRYNY
ncbi:probable basic-leucine zipper transcription factor N [Drosophila innubila]|uniref:probable basic-leucine zipper transcription factor N n=1 Tax=Drosophila innubila TaxID=198719 RepID=UPI00148D94F8|nr:probable basic-leucine zipper transcription factor N [Drosophila innubila]XP_034490160.1 probable basic-leucine zipper transcription factor N [Drosophila innubila]